MRVPGKASRLYPEPPGLGRVENGSKICERLPLAFRVCEKSPMRSSAVGSVTTEVVGEPCRSPSYPRKKNISLDRQTEPPIFPPNWLRWKMGLGLPERLFAQELASSTEL